MKFLLSFSIVERLIRMWSECWSKRRGRVHIALWTFCSWPFWYTSLKIRASCFYLLSETFICYWTAEICWVTTFFFFNILRSKSGKLWYCDFFSHQGTQLDLLIVANQFGEEEVPNELYIWCWLSESVMEKRAECSFQWLPHLTDSWQIFHFRL